VADRLGGLAAVRWRPGDAFLARYESADGVIRGALPLRVVGEKSGYLATWLPAGTTVARPVLADGRGLRECSVEERYSLPRASRVAPMDTDPAVILFPSSGAHSIHVFEHGWYVNLERTHVWHERGLDTRDHLLDIVCTSRGVWAWKDEDELADAVAFGALTQADADVIRAEGERVVALFERWEPPFSDGWEAWRPDPAWSQPELPEDWAA
jgi:hypothetical protein